MNGFWFGFGFGAVAFGMLVVAIILLLDKVSRWTMGVDREAEQENKRSQFR
ncbi:MAG TPA: hypothetical protein VNM39_05050 [Verrucomicrobiae bacterium]|nr:hypothetical protein [Verrucomicrobiae bacterium]